MANTVVTTTTNLIKAEFNDYYPVTTKYSKGSWRKDKIVCIEKYATFLEIIVLGEHTWRVSHNGADSSLQIDTVDGVSPSDLDDLYNKLVALLG